MTDKQNQAMTDNTAGELIEDIHKFVATGNAAKAIEVERSARELLQDALPVLESLQSQLAASEAKVDSLMFEYCPDEMTPEQIAEYENHLAVSDAQSLLDKEET